MRESMVFYRSFYEAIKDLSAEDFKKTVCTLLEYGLNEVEPTTTGIEKTVFVLVKPQIDKNNIRYQNAKKGGRGKNEPNNKSDSECKPNDNQNKTEYEPNINQTRTKRVPNVNVNDNANVNDNVINISCIEQKNSDFVASFALKDGTAYKITKAQVDKWGELYPLVDVMSELGRINEWCNKYPKKRKERAGAIEFILNWLANSQNYAQKQKLRPKSNGFHNFEQRNYSDAFYEELENRDQRRLFGEN